MKRLPSHSLFRSLSAVLFLVLTMAGALGLCCGEGHGACSQDAPCECVCVCLCHSISVTTHDAGLPLISRPVAYKHPLVDEDAPNSAFALGIDHPPEI
jgi:hypothetical protein